MSPKKKVKICAADRCRKHAKNDTDFCLNHKPEEPFDPIEDVLKLTPHEAERWGRLDAEIRNALLGQRVKYLEMQMLEVEEQRRRQTYKNQQLTGNQEIKALAQNVQLLRAQYQVFTKDLAEKYQVDITKMSIDPDTRVIREVG